MKHILTLLVCLMSLDTAKATTVLQMDDGKMNFTTVTNAVKFNSNTFVAPLVINAHYRISSNTNTIITFFGIYNKTNILVHFEYILKA